jgi:hypothetical protein
MPESCFFWGFMLQQVKLKASNTAVAGTACVCLFKQLYKARFVLRSSFLILANE